MPVTPPLISADELAQHLNLESDFSDAERGLLEQKSAAAQAFIFAYTGEFDDAVPEPVCEAIRQLAAALYSNREAVTPESLHPIPFGIFELIGPYRQWSF